MFTQSISTLNEERIQYYKNQIAADESSTIITLGMQPKDESIEDIYESDDNDSGFEGEEDFILNLKNVESVIDELDANDEDDAGTRGEYK